MRAAEDFGLAAGETSPDPELHNARREFAPRVIASSSEFVRGFTPPDYILDGLLQRGFCYSLTGATGVGKTTFAMLIAVSVAKGWPVGDRAVEQGPILFFAGENADDVRMRWIAMAEHLDFDIDEINVHFVPGVFKIPEIRARLQREAQRLGGFSLVIIDTSAAYFGGSDENDNVQMGAHARQLRELTSIPGNPCVIVNCHPVKNASAENLLPRGGGAFVAEVDGNLTCTRRHDAIYLHWQGKFRGPDFDPIPFETRTVTAARLKDSKGRPIPTVIARLLSASEQRSKAAGARADEDAVLVTLADAEDDLSVANVADALGWVSVKGEPQKSKAYRIIERLREDKLVVKERGSYVLNEKGKAAAKKARYNRDAAGACYG
jgi:hypothetical protein